MLPISDNNPPASPTARIWSPKQPGKYFLVALGNWSGHWVHWIGKRNEPCLGEDCPKARHRRPIKWVGYLPAALHQKQITTTVVDNWVPVVIALGPDNATLLREHLRDFPGPVFSVDKKGGDHKYEVTVIEGKRVPAGLPACPRTELTLARVWGIRLDDDRTQDTPPADPIR